MSPNNEKDLSDSRLKKAFLKDDLLLADIQSANSDKDLNIWWLGQSGFLLKWLDQYLLFDPYLSDSLTRKYAATEKPHVRITEQVVDPSKMDFIDLVTSSHNHTDHLDGETLSELIRVNPDLNIVVPKANLIFAADRLEVNQDRLTPISENHTLSIGHFKLSSVPAAHDLVERDDIGNLKYIGLIAEMGPWTVYHSGDTRWFPGILNALAKWKIDLAFLPINGFDPARRVAGNLDGEQAAILAKELQIGTVVPHHYDMFEFNTADPKIFEAECHRLDQSCHVLRQGQRLTLYSN